MCYAKQLKNLVEFQEFQAAISKEGAAVNSHKQTQRGVWQSENTTVSLRKEVLPVPQTNGSHKQFNAKLLAFLPCYHPTEGFHCLTRWVF